MRYQILFLAAFLSGIVCAQTVVDVTGRGASKTTVAVNVGGAGAATYTKTLKKNLERSGCFVVEGSGSIKVTGTVGGTITASGAGRTVSVQEAAGDEKAVRMAARVMSDRICETFAKQKGFAQDRIVFISKKGADKAELCVCYPDGQDIRQLTSDNKAVVGPRWKNDSTLLYTGFLNGGPRIWEMDIDTGKRSQVWSVKGLSTGATLSPDGTKIAVIFSFQGNPDLYVVDVATGNFRRLTNTPNASEGQPSWSPDGRKIVYVSDETRHPQLYIIDVATKSSKRLTSKGSQNVDPDWGDDGRIAYITKRGGLSQVAVLEPSEGDGSAQLVTKPGSWEHPSWARDMRHVVAGRDKALFVVDTLEDGDQPMQLFFNNGNWINASWIR